MSARRRLALAVVVAAVCLPARADRLHLSSGGIIEADHWWIEGDTLHVESSEGTVGLPRALLVRVEPTVSPVPRPDPIRKDKTPAPAARVTATAGKPATPETIGKMREANGALVARDFETAARRFHEVVQAEPGASGPRAGYALAEIALGRDAMALPVVLDGLAVDPSSAPLLEILGDLRDRDERVEDALASWREAFRVDPNDRLRDKIVKAERELAAGRDYSFSAAAHFNLRYDGDLDQDLVASITDFLEDRFHEFASAYRHAPLQPITVLLYPQQAFHDVTQSGPDVAGLYDGKIRVPLGGLRRLDPGAERVLTHELTHAFVQSKTRGNCPRWLHEGLAQVAEPRVLRRSDAQKLAQSVRADAPATWPDAAFSYPAALSFTRFLEERRGFDGLVAVLDRLGDGDSLDAALQALYGMNYAEIVAAWADTLRGQAP